MKFITSFALAFILIFLATLVEASEYYPVGITKEHKEGVYKDGKLFVAAIDIKRGPGEDQNLIGSVEKVRDTLFYTEYKGYGSNEQCRHSALTRSLKMKVGKNKVITLNDTISGYISKIATDQNFLYFVSAKDLKKGNLVRLSSDGKQRKVLENDVEDFWYANNQIYYVKNRTGYSINPVSLKTTTLDLGSRKLYPPSYCKVSYRQMNNYRISENGLMYIARKTKKYNYVFDFYSFKTKKITQHVLSSTTTLYNKEMSSIQSSISDIDNKTGEFIEQGDNGLELFSPGGRTLKVIISEKEFNDFYSIRFLRIDIFKREIVLVKGTKLITKNF